MTKLTINPEFSLEKSCILHIYHDIFKHKDNTPLEFIDIVKTYKNNKSRLRSYTSVFTNFTKQLPDSELKSILQLARLYHFYLPGNMNLVPGIYNITYVNFYSDNHRLLFNLKYPDIDIRCATNDIISSNFYHSFKDCYLLYIMKNKHEH